MESSSLIALLLAVFSFIACTMMIPPLVLKIRARNIPLSTIIASILVNTLFRGVNALIWPEISSEHPNWNGEGLCDVEVELFTAIDVAIPAGLLCLFRQLARIMKTTRLGVKPSKTQQQRTVIFDVFFCIVLPILSMPAAFAVQPGRYAITAVSGCNPIIEMTFATYFLVLGWPALLTVLSLIYASIAIKRMLSHYNGLSLMFADLPQGSRTQREIFRTYIFAIILFVVHTPFVVFSLLRRTKVSWVPYFSWAEIHPDNWSERIYIAMDSGSWFVFFGFTSVIFAFLALWCFGSGQDVKDKMKLWKVWIQSVLKK